MLGRRPCRQCGAPCHRENRWQLCPGCRLQFCQSCGNRLPEGRLSRQCLACTRAEKERLYAKERPCRDCHRRLPAGCRTERCPQCRRVEYLHYCSLPARPCRACGKSMPAGRKNSYCTDCYREKRERREKENGLLWCAACGKHRRARASSYCRACAGMRASWRRRYLQGDPLARMLRPKRTNERRQKSLKEKD